MLSIRKVLEENGKEVLNTIVDYNNISFNEVVIQHFIVGKGYDTFTKLYLVCHFKGEQAIEQACRQYVKEYGFKLEWLGDSHLKALLRGEIKLRFNVFGNSILASTNNSYYKVISWLYANDIKIKEE